MIPIAETDPPVHALSLGASLLRGAPRSYALLFFSANERLGWWLLAISMLAPDLGLAGLAGVCAAGALAWWLGYDRASIRNGYLLFNPLLVCLTLAYLHRCYHFHTETYLALWCASVIGAFFLAVAMQQWVGTHFGMSAQSLPAVASAYVLYFLGFALFGPPGLPASAGIAWLDEPSLPPFWEAMFQAFGAMLFQPHVLPGILVFAGLGIASPISTLVASLAFTVGAATMWGLGFPLGPEGVTWCGFNFLLAGIALGSAYFITSGASLLLAASGAFLCSLVSLALATALRYFSLPASALPYNLVVLALVYALRSRRAAGALHPSPSPGALPESAARQVLLDARRFPHLKTPALFLPFDGDRVVTQAFDGALTHRGAWRFALDFEAEKSGKKHDGSGAALTDFYVFDTPVLSPCAGVVANVVNHVPDNAPGGNNPDENWGNHVVISGDAGYCVLLAHLKQNSVAVFAGQRVVRGTLLGRCGNSGRSPVPHLHVQIQDSVFPGAATRPFCLKHYVELRDGRDPEYHTSGVPASGARVQPATPSASLGETLYGWLPGEYRYRITSENGVSREETLLLDFDDAGRYRLRSRRTHARLAAFFDEGVFYTNEFEGDDRSLLAFIAAGLARVPCIADSDVMWRDHASAAPFFQGPERWLRDFIEPFFGPFLLRFTYRVAQDAAGFVVRAVAEIENAAPRAHAPREIACALAARRGIVRLEARLHNDHVIRAELADYQPLG
jgi:urea transporter